MNFDNYKFRCSSLGKLMVGVSGGLTQKQEETYEAYKLRYKGEGRPLTEKQEKLFFQLGEKKHAKPELSQTTKKYLDEVFIEQVYNRRKEISSKYLSKGTEVEEDSLTLYSEVTGNFLVKNKVRLENDYLTGEPDNKQGRIRDIKSSWDIFTFPMSEDKIPNKDYEWQILGYQELTGLKDEPGELIYCLVDTPLMLIEDEKRRFSWASGMIELPSEVEAEIENKLIYNDVPLEKRVKIFEVEFQQQKIDALYKQIEIAREYLNSKL